MRPLLPALLLLLAAAPAPRTLGPQGYGPVRVGMPVAAAERALGAKLAVVWFDEHDRACGYARRRDGRERDVAYMVEKGRISRVDIEAPRVRTAAGIGIGSAAAQVRKAYGRAIRVSPNAYSDGRYFTVRGPAGHGLVFEIEGGKVAAMRGGRFPSVSYIEGCA